MSDDDSFLSMVNSMASTKLSDDNVELSLLKKMIGQKLLFPPRMQDDFDKHFYVEWSELKDIGALTLTILDNRNNHALGLCIKQIAIIDSLPANCPKWSVTLIQEQVGKTQCVMKFETTSVLEIFTDADIIKYISCNLRNLDISCNFGRDDSNGHWKKSYLDFNRNCEVMTDDIWQAFLLDGYSKEYLIVLCLASRIEYLGALPNI